MGSGPGEDAPRPGVDAVGDLVEIPHGERAEVGTRTDSPAVLVDFLRGEIFGRGSRLNLSDGHDIHVVDLAQLA
jgi:hypothetical protein